MRLHQIPFSHNCVKVRKALDLKGLEYETVDINAARRGKLSRISGQPLVPVLEDDGRVISDSTAILLYLEERYPQRPLLPADPAERAECLLLEDWADRAFMELTRRMAYWNLSARPDLLGRMFFGSAPAPVQRIAGQVVKRILGRRFGLGEKQSRRDADEAPRLAELAVARLGGRDHLVGSGITIADVALAAMSAGLALAPPDVRDHPAVRELLGWGSRVMEMEREFVLPAGAVPQAP